MLLEQLQKDDYRFHLRQDNLRPGMDFSMSASSSAVDNNLLGNWELCYASNGTVGAACYQPTCEMLHVPLSIWCMHWCVWCIGALMYVSNQFGACIGALVH